MFLHRGPTYGLSRKIPRVAGSPNYVPDVVKVARTTAGANSRTLPGAATSWVANTDGQGARLRAEPSRESHSIMVLPDGTLVQPLGPVQGADEQDWRRVRTEAGTEGWIASHLFAPAMPGEQ